MAVKAVRHEILFVLRPAALVHFGVQRGEEKILQDGLVEDGILVGWSLSGAKPLRSLCELALVEKLVGDQTLFLHEPAENQPGDQADEADVVVPVSLLGRVLGKLGRDSAPRNTSWRLRGRNVC